MSSVRSKDGIAVEQSDSGAIKFILQYLGYEIEWVAVLFPGFRTIRNSTLSPSYLTPPHQLSELLIPVRRELVPYNRCPGTVKTDTMAVHVVHVRMHVNRIDLLYDSYQYQYQYQYGYYY